ncbi:hypothetical protein WMY93_032991 [Mugilogobius chulae]|uniref:Ig-like domain-containing protein n=1 Tax=Mugilogobius chulae TaxID=88201 RepID=A0AAW0MMG0_9GOBI
MESALCTLLSALVVLLCSSPECKGEDTVSQPAGDVLLTQGETVEIECSYQTSYASPTLFWYKQEGQGAPRYMMKLFGGTIVKSSEFDKDRFKAALNKTSVSLSLQDVDVTDSAVYYCALQPTVTGNTKTLNKNLWSKDNTILHSGCAPVFFPECKGEDTVSQPAGDVLLTQRETVEIECTFETSYSPTLFWYKQEGRGAPEYMMKTFESGLSSSSTVKSTAFDKPKFDAKLKKNLISLKIQVVDVTDSAVYYCALKPTVTGNTKTLNKNLWSKDNTILQ